MRKLVLVICGLLLVLAMATPAGAQYVSEPGSGPAVGNTDTGARSSDGGRAARAGRRSAAPDDGTEVLGIQFVRGEDGQIHADFALTGADVAQLAGIGVALMAVGVVLKRRSRRIPLAA